MALSIYVHIPYCIQRCRYCDFTTFEAEQLMPPPDYVQMILREIRQRQTLVTQRTVSSVYFGGDTPSLIPAELIVSILNELANAGFKFTPDCEITLEINPATIDPRKVEVYLKGGVNRFSVGAQTFNDRLLGLCGRRHSAEDTRHTLRLLAGYDLNYSFDLLFALPSQSISDLQTDLKEVAAYDPPHLSAYCLTVPSGHPMDSGRPPEGEQIEMFSAIETALGQLGTRKYEISNFAKPGFESKHNLAYWTDRSYWGLGLSSHSYFSTVGFGVRFWNPKSFTEYARQIEGQNTDARFPFDFLPAEQKELLEAHESLTDFCHTQLRTADGLSLTAVRNKYSSQIGDLVRLRAISLLHEGLLNESQDTLALTGRGQLLSNQVFSHFYFQSGDL